MRGSLNMTLRSARWTDVPRGGSPRLRGLLVACLLASIPLAFPPAGARADEASEAQLQDELGRELYGQRRYREALEHFLASNRLVPNPNVMANIGSCYGILRRRAEAFNWYEAALQAGLEETARPAIERAQDRLRRRVAVVAVGVRPEDAAIYVDRVELGSVGRGSRDYAVEPGERTLIARAEGHREARVEVTAVRGETVSAELALERVVGRLQVVSDPEGAVVLRDDTDEVLGETPLFVELPPGGLDLRVQAEGYEARTSRAAVRDGEVTRVRVELAPAASRMAVLTVAGRPAGARVLLDGVALGPTPLTRDSLEPGRRTLRVERAGRDPWEGPVVLEAGSASRVDYDLRDPRAGPDPGWFIAGYGLGAGLLVAGGGTAIAAGNARDRFFDQPTRAARDQVDRLNGTADGLLIAGGVVLLGTLIADLLTGGEPASRAEVTIDR